jgi:hypothetical protein
MESIQWMVPLNSPLIALAQQGVEVVGHIVAAAPTTENHRGEPSGGNQSNDYRSSDDVMEIITKCRRMQVALIMMIGHTWFLLAHSQG